MDKLFYVNLAWIPVGITFAYSIILFFKNVIKLKNYGNLYSSTLEDVSSSFVDIIKEIPMEIQTNHGNEYDMKKLEISFIEFLDNESNKEKMKKLFYKEGDYFGKH